MNREIKFRGKDLIHNKWIYGGLAEDRHDNAVILPKNNWQKGGCVDKYTIGQFTGLRDINGREIYEGDIVNFDDSLYSVYAHSYTGKVVFYKGQFCVEHYEDCFTTTFYTPLFKDDFADKKTTVLGNIYDNPELLKGESK